MSHKADDDQKKELDGTSPRICLGDSIASGDDEESNPTRSDEEHGEGGSATSSNETASNQRNEKSQHGGRFRVICSPVVALIDAIVACFPSANDPDGRDDGPSEDDENPDREEPSSPERQRWSDKHPLAITVILGVLTTVLGGIVLFMISCPLSSDCTLMGRSESTTSTLAPTQRPTQNPTQAPTNLFFEPTSPPSANPTSRPTLMPSAAPTRPATWDLRGGIINGTIRSIYGSQRLGFAVDMSDDGSILVVASPQTSNPFANQTGFVQAYEFDEELENWKEKGGPMAPQRSDNLKAGALFGTTVSLTGDGNKVLIGAINAREPFFENFPPDPPHGRLEEYTWNDDSNNWGRTGIWESAIIGNPPPRVVRSSVLSGDGSERAWGDPTYTIQLQDEDDSYRGFVVTHFRGILPGREEFSNFGMAVDMSYDGNIVAAAGDEYVEVFRYGGDGGWVQYGSNLILGPPNALSDLSDFDFESSDILRGYISLSNDGTRIAVGYPERLGGRGEAIVYELVSDKWESIGSVEGSVNENLGMTVSLSADGTIVALGGQGPLRVYQYNDEIEGLEPFGRVLSDLDGDFEHRACALARNGRHVCCGDSSFRLCRLCADTEGQVRCYQLQ